MPKPKLHHTVPQTYLKRFSPDENTIFRYDKKSGEIKQLGIKNTSAENDYYTTIDKNGERDTFIESPLLSDIDGGYTPLIKKLQARTPLAKEKNNFAALMASGYARVPNQRSNIKRMLDDMNAQRRRLGAPIGDTTNTDLNIAMLAEAAVYSGVATGSHFAVVVADDQHEFITCDNPADKSFLPLTTEMCLFMVPEPKKNEYAPASPDMVEKLNRMTFNKARQYVYAKSAEAIKAILPK